MILEIVSKPDVLRYVSPVPIPRESGDAAFDRYRRLLESDGYGY